jgi:hypothetical protein
MGFRRWVVFLLATSVCSASLLGCDNETLSEYQANHIFGTNDGSNPPLECMKELGYCTDLATGLEWQVDPTGGAMKWGDRKGHCEDLTLGGGGWRLPDIGDLRSLIRGCSATQESGSCNLGEGRCDTGDCRDVSCDGCSEGNGPAGGCYWPDNLNGSCDGYSSTSAWMVYFDSGLVESDYIESYQLVRCVR